MVCGAALLVQVVFDPKHIQMPMTKWDYQEIGPAGIHKRCS
jgi:hypothetical protein